MSHTIQLTTEQFQALQSGQPITIEPPKPTITKWEPKGGIYGISFSNYLSKAGFAYNNSSQADSAAKQLRAYARQLAWLAENDDGWVADWSDAYQGKYQIYIEHNGNKINTHRNFIDRSIGLIYMSEANATKLAQLMNDGIVEF